ncbi:MAG: YraN family protein [Anaerovoracaceae bacterium]
MENIDKGKAGERIAAMFLKQDGYEIVEMNFRCRIGEIDIIAKKDDVLVFIEVKTRTTEDFGLPREAVDKNKIMKIKKVAALYLLSERIKNYTIRYDVFEVYCNRIENAF